jgi:hypothetical protein
VNVVRYAGPSRKESAEPLGICGLSKRASIWDFNNFANIDKTVLARNRATVGASPCHKSLTRCELEVKREPRDAAPNRPLGHSALATSETVVHYVDQSRFACFRGTRDHIQLEEDEVLRINSILKRRVTRYIAAAEEEWLYPERRVSTTDWLKLDDDWFLFPNLWSVSFTTGIMWGDAKGRGFALDEYGRTPLNPMYEDPAQRQREHVTFERAKREWAKKRLRRSRAQCDERLARGVGDRLIDDYLRREGLLAGPLERPYGWSPI